jgi:biofilm PGA synthesis protein PgaD
MIKLIIEHPKLQTFQQKYTSRIFTVLFWSIWFYIWTPLLVFIFWIFKLDIICSDVFNYIGFEKFLSDLQQCFIYISILCCLFIVWVAYNIFRFKNLCRYKKQQTINIQALSVHAKISKQCLEKCQETKVLTAQFDQQGQLVTLQNYNY